MYLAHRHAPEGAHTSMNKTKKKKKKPRLAASPPPPPVTIACNHPERLARALGLPITTIFEDTLTITTAVYTTIRAIISLFPGSSIATILHRVWDSVTTTTCRHTEFLAAAMRLRGEKDSTTLTTGISDVFVTGRCVGAGRAGLGLGWN